MAQPVEIEAFKRIRDHASQIEKNCADPSKLYFGSFDGFRQGLREISSLASMIALDSNRLFSETQDKNVELQKKLSELQRQLQDRDKEFEKRLKKIQGYENILFNEEKYDQIPHLGIETNTIFDLNGGTQQPGWRIISQDPERVKELSTKKIIAVGLLGPYDSGKTYVSNLLSNGKLPSGARYRTSAIEICYPEQDGVHFGIIDVPGSQEAHRISDPELIKKLPKKNTKAMDNLITPKVDEKVKDSKDSKETTSDYFNRYKLLHNDSKLIHDLKEKFITENADIVVVVCNKLSDSDQEMMYKIIKHYKDIIRSQMADKLANITALAQKQLYIVHNLKMLSKIADVKNQIQRDINLCFEVEESSMFNFGNGLTSQERGKYNDVLYRDQFGIAHLVLAANGTEAGDYYNTKTLEFLKSKIRNTDCKAPFDLCGNFLKFCNEHLKKMLGRKVTLKYNLDKTAFVKEETEDFQIDSLTWNSLGDFVPNIGQYQPKYAITTYQIDKETTKIIVDVELLDCKLEKSKLESVDGNWILKLNGEKRAEPAGPGDEKLDQDAARQLKSEFFNINREEGHFDLKIKLHESEDKKYKDRPQKENLNNGVVRYIFVFRETDREDFL